MDLIKAQRSNEELILKAKITIWKQERKELHRWCALDSNPGPQNGRRRRNHGAMAATMLVCPSLHTKSGRFFCLSFKVSICKFKFTGGAVPTLEEKKMLSVDSVGNFRYSTGNQQAGNRQTGHFRPNSDSFPDISKTNFLTGKSNPEMARRGPLGAVELISAFEAIPEKTGSGTGSSEFWR